MGSAKSPNAWKTRSSGRIVSLHFQFMAYFLSLSAPLSRIAMSEEFGIKDDILIVYLQKLHELDLLDVTVPNSPGEPRLYGPTRELGPPAEQT